MALYSIHFVDHGKNVYSTFHLEHDSDEGAIEQARRLNVPGIGAGFVIWQDERLVHRHRQ
jgi:hypothetical protein